MPPAITVTPAEAKPGDRVAVSAPVAACDAGYGPCAQVSVELLDAHGTTVLEEFAPMTDDGGFTFVFTVPAGMARGKPGSPRSRSTWTGATTPG
ncbi:MULTISPECIES: hypothetical protein [unclassified Arthrobacter]|uniref:hypothetical protein n=1 Tax=unclassified Arthrobacter TaxID=235627 RepID=UPI0033927430